MGSEMCIRDRSRGYVLHPDDPELAWCTEGSCCARGLRFRPASFGHASPTLPAHYIQINPLLLATHSSIRVPARAQWRATAGCIAVRSPGTRCAAALTEASPAEAGEPSTAGETSAAGEAAAGAETETQELEDLDLSDGDGNGDGNGGAVAAPGTTCPVQSA